MDLWRQALTVLHKQPGKWYCLPCWAEAAGITSLEDFPELGGLALREIETSSLYERGEAANCQEQRARCDRNAAEWRFAVRMKGSGR
jgi:hypothetical protein